MAKKVTLPATPAPENQELFPIPLESNVRSALEDSLGELEQGVQQNLDARFAQDVSAMFEQVNQAFLDPNFGGLLEVPPELAFELCSFWSQKLAQMKSHVRPAAFLCRMLPDGSVFMKAVSMPQGLIPIVPVGERTTVATRIPSGGVEQPNLSTYYSGMSESLAPSPPSGPVPVSTPGKLRKLSLGSDGTIEVKDPDPT